MDLTSGHNEVTAAIFLVAILCRFTALGPFLPIADRIHSAGIDSEGHQVILNSVGATITEPKIVLFAASLVTVALNTELDTRIALQEIGSVGQGRLLIVTDVRSIIVKIDVTYVPGESFF